MVHMLLTSIFLDDVSRPTIFADVSCWRKNPYNRQHSLFERAPFFLPIHPNQALAYQCWVLVGRVELLVRKMLFLLEWQLQLRRPWSKVSRQLSFFPWFDMPIVPVAILPPNYLSSRWVWLLSCAWWPCSLLRFIRLFADVLETHSSCWSRICHIAPWNSCCRIVFHCQWWWRWVSRICIWCSFLQSWWCLLQLYALTVRLLPTL